MNPRRLVPILALTAALSASAVTAAQAATTTLSASSTASAPTAAPAGAAGTTRTVTLPSGRTYQLFSPTKPAARPGLVVMLHGYTGTAVGMENHTNLDLGGGKTGNYVAYGQGVSLSWNAGTCCAIARDTGVDDVAYLDALIDDVKARTGLLEGRVVMAGYSNGAMMSYRYGCARPTRVGFILPVGGTSVYPCDRTTPLSVYAVHGALDTTVPWDGTKTSTLILGGVMPSVPSTLGGVAALDHCSGWVNDTTPAGVPRWTAQNCPAGVQVVALRSPNMAHVWPAGDNDKGLYGVDATALTWSMAVGLWLK